MYSECATRCSNAISHRPSPHCTNMKPIWAQVDHARATFTLTRVVITNAAITAVRVPTTTSAVRATTTRSTTGAKRSSTNPPRLTTPAWSSADTGVGASITWISQPWNGSCAHFNSAVSAISTMPMMAPVGSVSALTDSATTLSMRVVSNAVANATIAPTIARSAVRARMNFLWATATATGRSPKNVSRPCSARLVAAQAAANRIRSLATTTTATAPTVASIRAAYCRSRASPAMYACEYRSTTQPTNATSTSITEPATSDRTSAPVRSEEAARAAASAIDAATITSEATRAIRHPDATVRARNTNAAAARAISAGRKSATTSHTGARDVLATSTASIPVDEMPPVCTAPAVLSNI